MKTKKMNAINSLRLMSDIFPISQKAKKIHPELNFDMDWCVDGSCQYTIDNSGYFCLERWEMNKKTKKLEIVALERLNITQKIILNTDIIGSPARFVISLDEGKLTNIETVKIV